MRITTATIDDIPGMVELLSVLFAQEAEFSPDTEAQARGLSRIVSNPEVGFIAVAKEHGRVVGMVNVLFTVSTALGERVGILEDMIVSPSQRGTGIGSRLLRAAVAESRERGCKRLTLLTDGDNHAAHRFYARHGFKPSAMVPFRLSLE